MIKVKSSELKTIFTGLKKQKIAVIGDVMLDVYYWGDTNRISPEAPVPVIDISHEEIKPGGAANVALNLRSLGADTCLYGIIGNDINGSNFVENLKNYNINIENIIIDTSRPTTVKTRILASSQHVIRFDKEHKNSIDSRTEKKIIKNFEKNIKKLDGVILQDYNKGMLTPAIIKKIIKLCNENNIIVTVDPKLTNLLSFKGATLFKPNLHEAEEILGRKIKSETEIEKAGIDLLKKLDFKYVVITLSERGVAIFRKGEKMKIIPAKALKIANVSGAGDTVIATITAFMCAGATFEQACAIANYAASLVVEDVSIVPVNPDELLKRLKESGAIEKG
ncbi:MAG: D-glycero-beta-D-manno-heptose-7-phosphate kinase [Candidatus Delongbacteria bacterium]|nr:D-glycero-beta-D-manno-heptose-7-phosphate kinase [Candidatus Delongbacteria bacterium]